MCRMVLTRDMKWWNYCSCLSLSHSIKLIFCCLHIWCTELQHGNSPDNLGSINCRFRIIYCSCSCSVLPWDWAATSQSCFWHLSNSVQGCGKDVLITIFKSDILHTLQHTHTVCVEVLWSTTDQSSWSDHYPDQLKKDVKWSSNYLLPTDNVPEIFR